MELSHNSDIKTQSVTLDEFRGFSVKDEFKAFVQNDVGENAKEALVDLEGAVDLNEFAILDDVQPETVPIKAEPEWSELESSFEDMHNEIANVKIEVKDTFDTELLNSAKDVIVIKDEHEHEKVENQTEKERLKVEGNKKSVDNVINESSFLQVDTTVTFDSSMEETKLESDLSSKEMYKTDNDNTLTFETSSDVKETNSSKLNSQEESEKVPDSLVLIDEHELGSQIALVDTEEKNLTDKNSNKKFFDESSENKDAKCKEKNGDTQKNGCIIWISSLTHAMKATDLKRHLSKFGKVTTAKIVTDGKRCFGYVVMEKQKDVELCIKMLNGTYYEGKKIYLSVSTPEKENTEAQTKISSETHRPRKEDIADNRDKLESKSTDNVIRPKRLRSSDPLTTKFITKKSDKDSKKSSRGGSKTRYAEDKDRERNRRLQERRLCEDRARQRKVEEKHRKIEFQLEQERKKLRMERDLFEKERKEFMRLDQERRKIEREKLAMLREKAKLEDDIRRARRSRSQKRKFCEEYENKKTKSSKIVSDINSVEKAKDVDSIYEKRERDSLVSKREYLKPLKREEKEDHGRYKLKEDEPKRSDFKNFERAAPPPPKLTSVFQKMGRRSYPGYPDYWERSTFQAEAKPEPSERKFYSNYSNKKSDHQERKHDFPFIAERKSFSNERPSPYPRGDIGRYPYGQEPPKVVLWKSPSSAAPAKPSSGPLTGQVGGSGYSENWKAGIDNSFSRYYQPHFPPAYGDTSRISSDHYSQPSSADYSRFEHFDQVNMRKY